VPLPLDLTHSAQIQTWPQAHLNLHTHNLYYL